METTIRYVIARCPQCGVIFPCREYTRQQSAHKCCSVGCTQKAMRGNKPICQAEEIETVRLTTAEYRERQAATMMEKIRMKQAGQAGRTGEAYYAPEGRTALHVDRICANCGNTFRILYSKVQQGGGKYCGKACYTDIQKKQHTFTPVAPNVENDGSHGKQSFTTLSALEAAIAQLTAKGYCFRVPGRAFDIIAPQSDFYGLQWCLDHRGEKVFFYTTRQNVFKNYASR